MDCGFTPEQEAFRLEVREFIRGKLPEDWEESHWKYGFDFYSELDELGPTARMMSKELGAKGWLSIPWPKQYGGQEGSYIDQLILAEELAAQHCPGLEIFGAVIAPVLLEYGTEEQKKKFLSGIRAGTEFWCESLSEPDAGSDLASLKTLALPQGDQYVINGQKVWTSGAHGADRIFLLARTDPTSVKHRGLGAFLVDVKTPGITISPLINAVGEHEFNEIFFDDVRVPQEDLLGDGTNGWRVTMRLLDYERTFCVPFYAEAEHYLESLVEYARQSGCLCPALRERTAHLLAECKAARLLTYRAASLADKGLPFSIEAAMSKVFGSELNQRVATLGMEIVGPHSGLLEGSKWAALDGQPAWRYLRSLGNTLEMGTSEVDRIVLAQRGLELPRE